MVLDFLRKHLYLRNLIFNSHNILPIYLKILMNHLIASSYKGGNPECDIPNEFVTGEYSLFIGLGDEPPVLF